MDEETKKLMSKAMDQAEKYGYFHLWMILYLLPLLKAGDESVSVAKFDYTTGLVATLPFDEEDLDGETMPTFVTVQSESLYDQGEAAEELGIETRTIQRWGQGKNPVPSLKIGKKRYYRMSDLTKYAKQLGHRIDWRTGKIVATKFGENGLQTRR